MDRRERAGSPTTAMLAAFEGWQAGIWTTLVGVLVPRDGEPTFSTEHRTVRVQPITQVRAQNPDGSFDWLTMPVLPDVPVIFPSGGGCTLTFPLKDGDEVVVLIASRCIDAWWQNGGKTQGGTPTPQVQMEFRMHDLSDGFCLAGVNSVPFVIPAISTTTAQFRNDAGDTYVEIDPDGGFVNVITPGDVGVQAGGSINAQAGNDITADAGNNIAATAGSNITADAGGDVQVTSGGHTTIDAAGGATINAPTVTINAATTTINGAVIHNGPTALNGPISQAPGSGGGTNATLVGPVHVTNDVTSGGISLNSHHHSDPQGGNTGGPS